MMTYEVEYRNLNGKKMKDLFRSSNKSVLYATLQQKGLLPIRIREVNDETAVYVNGKDSSGSMNRKKLTMICGTLLVFVVALIWCAYMNLNRQNNETIASSSKAKDSENRLAQKYPVNLDDGQVESANMNKTVDEASCRPNQLDEKKTHIETGDSEIPEGDIEFSFGSEGGELIADPIELPAKTSLFFSIRNRPVWTRMYLSAENIIAEGISHQGPFVDLPNGSFTSTSDTRVFIKAVVAKNTTNKPRWYTLGITVDGVEYTAVIYQSESDDSAEVL